MPKENEEPKKQTQGITQREITDELKESYLDYAMSVIVSRALPDVRDGLKPVHRRILWAMQDMGLTHTAKFVKSARVVGECFMRDTLVSTKRGLVPIQNIERGEMVYTQNGLRKVTELYEMPPKELLKVVLENGIEQTITPSQKFKVLKPNLSFEWKEGSELGPDDFLASRSVYSGEVESVVLGNYENRRIELNEGLAYVTGLFVSDGWITEDYGLKKHARFGFVSEKEEVMQKVQCVLLEKFDYSPSIEKRAYELQTKKGILKKEVFKIRINRLGINDFLRIQLGIRNVNANGKEIPEKILQSPAPVINAFLSGLFEGDGYISVSRNMMEYATISKKLAQQLATLLHSLGIRNTIYTISPEKISSSEINGRKVKARHTGYSIEIKGEHAATLSRRIYLANREKQQKVARLQQKTITSHDRKGFYKQDIIPYAGKVLFQELSETHIGSGWYLGNNGEKFRAGIKYPDGTKIRYAKNLQEKPLRATQIVEWGIYEKLEKINSPFFEFIREVIENNLYFARVKSIEKASAEKTYDIQVEGEHEFLANGVVSHNCLGKYHPHGDVAVYDSMVRMAQDFSLRYPLIKGQGNFGCFTGDTKIKLTDGRSVSFVGLTKENKEGKKNYTYTFNHKTEEIEVAEIKHPRLTRKKAELVKVVLDNGEEIRCTPNHRFMLRDGAYREAQGLKKGDSLMPGYGVPKLENALQYFENFVDIKKETPLYNHKVVQTETLKNRENVYDITIDDSHNFLLDAGVFVHNSIDGDGAAAQRYTEAKLSKIASEMLLDIEKETVEWNPNYDASRKEPSYLPAKLPNLLLNGTMGIAVGMATSIPPHNLGEIADATSYLIENPNATVGELMNFIPGPDFPTGGIIYDRRAIEEAYRTGKGSVPIRAVASIEEKGKGNAQIVITEIPYQVNKSELIVKMASLVQEKKVEGIKDIRDESDREGIRIVVETKSDAIPQKILNKLFQQTDLQKNFYLNMIALVGGIQPRLLSLKDILGEYIAHRKIVVRRRAEFDLKKAKERAHILEGLVKALDVIDKVIATIKKSKDRETAEENLIKTFKFTKIQANAILDMRLATLAALEREKLENELKEKRKLILELEDILKNPKKILQIVKSELADIEKDYGDERRTKIVKGGLKEFREEDLVPDEEAIIALSRTGYIKRMPPGTFKAQKRGGKGLIGSEVKEEDQIEHFQGARTHDNILFFTNKGKVFQTKVYEVPEATRTSKGKLIYNFLEIPQSDQISALVTYREEKDKYLTLVTKKGIIKKTPIADFANVRRTGIIAVTLKKEDELRWAMLAEQKDEIMVVTKNGQSIRFREKDVRPMGRNAAGVTSIKLKKNDEVVGLDIIRKGQGEKLLIVMANGFAKQTLLKEYKIQRRGGSGIKTARVTGKTGEVISARIVGSDEGEIIAFSSKGQALRTELKDIRKTSRDTQGVRVMNLKQGDRLVGIVCL